MTFMARLRRTTLLLTPTRICSHLPRPTRMVVPPSPQTHIVLFPRPPQTSPTPPRQSPRIPLLLAPRVVVIALPTTRLPTPAPAPAPAPAHFHPLLSSIPPKASPSVQTVTPFTTISPHPRPPLAMAASTIVDPLMRPACTAPSIQPIAPRAPPRSHLLRPPGSVLSLTVHVSQWLQPEVAAPSPPGNVPRTPPPSLRPP
jgi:hypothetical protein